uniref:Uncharacterized protein n=1 Tax=Ditylenchus dipsaci TaxID=166011 RepID=A0A915CYC5_9BILA
MTVGTHDSRVMTVGTHDTQRRINVLELEEVFKSLGAQKQAWYQSFTGNHCRKLLAGDGPKRIADVIAGNSKHSAVEKLLTVLGEAQGLAKAAFLNCAEVEQLSELTKVNEDERRFASIGVREKILKRLMEESYIRNCLFDTHDIVGE